MESIKDKIAIVGMGCTKFGELWDKDPYDMVVDAAYEAFEDAGVEPKDIQAAWVGSFLANTGGASLSIPLQLQYIPVTRVENFCATGIETLRAAAYSLAAKVYDLVLAVGFEKYKDRGISGGVPSLMIGHPHPVYNFLPGASGPASYALAATRYFDRYGLSPEEGKRIMAMVSVKNHHNGFSNPKAHLRREVTIEEVMNAPIIAWPLGLYDCCGVTDGAAAAVLCRAEDADKYRKDKDWVTIKGIGISVGPGQGDVNTDYDYTHWEETTRAARQAYMQAGITNPREQLDLIECHDCFTIAEIIALESLGICEPGEAKEDLEAGTFTAEGRLPVNISGGLKSFGHPVGASGCRETYEIYKQIQGKAELPSRQIKDVKLGLIHNQGGKPGLFQCGVAIIGLPGV